MEWDGGAVGTSGSGGFEAFELSRSSGGHYRHSSCSGRNMYIEIIKRIG